MNAPANSPGDSPHLTAPRPGTARQPLVGVTLAVILGIASSAKWPMDSELWLFGALVSLMMVFPFRRKLALRGAISRGPLLLFAALLAGGWYRERTAAPADDLSHFIQKEGMLARLQGVLASEPVTTLLPKPFETLNPQASRQTKMFLRVERIQWTGGWMACAGGVEARIAGESSGLRAGDRIELFGWLSRPLSPANEGEFDYPAFLEQRGIHATLKCEHPDGVKLLEDLGGLTFRGVRDRIRGAGRLVFHRYLAPSEAALADALVLGFRTSLTREDIEPFQETGTLHLLVVSGTHVFILVAILMVSTNLVGMSLRARVLFVMSIVLLYATITGGDPPVLRAATVTIVYLAGFLARRTPRAINSLAGAALLVLIADPASLLRVGSQLSFLAVLAILFMIPSLNKFIEGWHAQDRSDGRWFSVARHFFVRWFSECFVVSGVVSLAIAPLVIDRFHLLTPSGVLLSVVLLPLITLALVLGGALLASAAFLPLLAWILSFPMGWCLFLVREAVAVTDSIPFAHVYLLAPPTWWMVGFYLFLFLPGCLWGRRALGRLYLAGNLAWQLLGVLLCLPGPAPRTVEYHQLAVGHGNCGVLRYPTGETILYDCGSLANGDVTDRTIAPWLWSQGIGRIDAVLVSHADVDHFNGLERLARQFPIGVVFITPQIASSRQTEVETLLGHLLGRGVPVRIVWGGDRLRVGEVEHYVLEPTTSRAYGSDNAASMVVECRWEGHSLLLTGDLSDEGLARLLTRPRREMDVLIAPHHGSRSSNDERLARWASPRVVISPQGRRKNAEDSLAVYAYGGAVTLRTDREGGISCRWEPRVLRVHCFRSRDAYEIPLVGPSNTRELARLPAPTEPFPTSSP